MTKFCCWDKDFHKNSPVHIKVCCCNVSPSVFQTLGSYKDKEKDCNFAKFCHFVSKKKIMTKQYMFLFLPKVFRFWSIGS